MKLRHPDLDSKATIEVDEDSREVYESQGWVEVGAKKPADSNA